MDVIADFEAIVQEVRDARPVPFSASAIIDRKDLLERLEGLLEAVPGELKKARWVIEDRDEVLARIQREAQETLERARQERDRMVSRPEVDRAASAEAVRIIEGAKAQARQIRLEAEHFVDGKLASLEVGLQKMLALVQSASASFPDRSAPVRPASSTRATAKRPARAAEAQESSASAGGAPGASSTERRPAPRGQGTPARPKVHRPASPARDPAAPGRPSGAPGVADAPPGSVRSLGLGSPATRSRGTPPKDADAPRSRPNPEHGPATGRTTIRLDRDPPPGPAEGVIERTGEIPVSRLSSRGAPEPGDGSSPGASPTTLF